MKSLLESCHPKEDVLEGRLTEDTFAADLQAVYAGKAPEVYGNPVKFFENTFPTDGMKTLMKEAFGRLTGKDAGANPVIKLETSFGGGKTHSLIALYHAAKSPQSVDLEKLLGPKLALRQPIRTVVLSGTAYSASSTREEGKIRPRTLWGEIALQAGGETGYSIIQKSDEDGSAPGTQLLEKALPQEPVLVLIDEIAHYLRTISERPGRGRALAEQTVAFLHQLMSIASTNKSICVVMTLATEADAYAKETAQVSRVLQEVVSITARSSFSISPTSEAEISDVLKKRLFEKIESKAAEAVADSYFNLYRGEARRRTILPEKATGAEFKAEMARSYPFHPELIDTLNRKLSTISTFQRTRGVLRLLALVVRDLWEKKEVALFIMPYHVDLSNDAIQTELTDRLERPKFRPAIQHDISSNKGDAISQQLDDNESGEKTRTASRTATAVATVVFLNSLVSGQAGGVDLPGLHLATIAPEFSDREQVGSGFGLNPKIVLPPVSPEAVDDSLKELLDECWFIYDTGSRYIFRTEFNLNKVISEEQTNVFVTEARARIETVLKSKFSGATFEAKFFPSEPVDVPDDPESPKLVVLHWDSDTVSKDGQIPELVSRIFERAGEKEGFRIYRNNVYFLVGDDQFRGNMTDVARYALAVERIVANKNLTSTLSEEQRNKLDEKKKKSELELAEAVITCYRYLYYPSAADGLFEEDRFPLRQYTLKVDKAADLQKSNQQKVILEALIGLQKVVAGNVPPPGASYVEDKVWPKGKTFVSALDLRMLFAQKPYLPLILDPDTLKKTIRDGVEQGIWVYQHGELVYEKGSKPIPIQLTEESLLFLPEEAKKRGITAFPTEKGGVSRACPVCGQDPCVCEIRAASRGALVTTERGDVHRVFAQLVENAKGQRIARLERMDFGVYDLKSLRALDLLIPQLGKARVTQDIRISCEETENNFEVSFKGSWDNYRQRKDHIEGLVGNSQVTIDARFQLLFSEPLDATADGVKQIQDTLKKLGAGSLDLKGYAALGGR